MSELKIRGYVKHWQTDENGNVVPGTVKEDHNAITDSLRNYLAQVIGAEVLGKAVDTLFTSQDLGLDDGGDGIAWGQTNGDVSGKMVTTKNAGGTGNEAYIEFYGTVQASGAAITIGPYLLLGTDYSSVAYALGTVYATYAINETVPDGRTYHFYWKITIS